MTQIYRGISFMLCSYLPAPVSLDKSSNFAILKNNPLRSLKHSQYFYPRHLNNLSALLKYWSNPYSMFIFVPYIGNILLHLAILFLTAYSHSTSSFDLY